VLVDKITLHWSATDWYFSDSGYYHVLIQYNPKDRKANPKKMSNYTDRLPHTWHRNTGNIGICACCLGGENINEHNFGNWPLMKNQIEELCKVSAEICYLKNIDPYQVKTHAEYAIEDGYFGERWDLAILYPLKPGEQVDLIKKAKETADLLRGKVMWYLNNIEKKKYVRSFHYENK